MPPQQGGGKEGDGQVLKFERRSCQHRPPPALAVWMIARADVFTQNIHILLNICQSRLGPEIRIFLTVSNITSEPSQGHFGPPVSLGGGLVVPPFKLGR